MHFAEDNEPIESAPYFSLISVNLVAIRSRASSQLTPQRRHFLYKRCSNLLLLWTKIKTKSSFTKDAINRTIGVPLLDKDIIPVFIKIYLALHTVYAYARTLVSSVRTSSQKLFDRPTHLSDRVGACSAFAQLDSPIFSIIPTRCVWLPLSANSIHLKPVFLCRPLHTYHKNASFVPLNALLDS